MRMYRILVPGVLLLAILGLVTFLHADETASKGDKKERSPLAAPRDWGPRRTPVVEAVKRVRAAVVNIHSERTVQGTSTEDLFANAPSQNRINGMGTGIIIDPRGYI